MDENKSKSPPPLRENMSNDFIITELTPLLKDLFAKLGKELPIKLLEEPPSEELKARIEELGVLNTEFMKDYNPKILEQATIISGPLIQILDDTDSKKTVGEVPVEEVFRIYKEIGIKTIEIAARLTTEGPGFYQPKPTFGYDSMEIGLVFMTIMGRRFGDKNNLTAIGWGMMLNGINGIDSTPEEEIASSKNYFSQFFPEHN